MSRAAAVADGGSLPTATRPKPSARSRSPLGGPEAQARRLRSKGLPAGVLWIPDSESLSKAKQWLTFSGLFPFSDSDEARALLARTRRHVTSAYGLKLAHEPGRGDAAEGPSKKQEADRRAQRLRTSGGEGETGPKRPQQRARDSDRQLGRDGSGPDSANRLARGRHSTDGSSESGAGDRNPRPGPGDRNPRPGPGDRGPRPDPGDPPRSPPPRRTEGDS